MKLNSQNSKFSSIIVLVVMLVLLYLRFPDFFQTPNDRVAAAHGDGFKAYMCIYNHAKYDSTYAHFESMNYPYGEHAIPGATQPFFSNGIRFISDYLVDITAYTIGIVNVSMILGILFCALFLYLIFRRLGLPLGYSTVVAVGLSFLNPQMQRMGAHYGLAHPEVIPMILYLLLRFELERKWKWSAWIAVTVTAFSLIHFYYFAVLAFLISFYFLFLTLRDKAFSIKLIVQNFKHYSLQILLPLAFFVYWMYWNDPVNDRCSAPWGFFFYNGSFSGIFASLEQPFFQNLGLKKWGIENKSYVGVVATLMSLFLVIKVAISLFRKAPIQTAQPKTDNFLNNIFFSGVVIVLFSLGLPFTIEGMAGYLEYAGPIQQFRSVGRFAWVFFYVINIIAFYWLFTKITRRKWLLLFPLLLLNYEAWNHTFAFKIKLHTVKEFDEKLSFANIDSINYTDYQAVVPIPYYNIGSDQFWLSMRGFIGPTSQMIAMQTGLPTTGAMLTRTSLSQTMNQLQLVQEPYRLPKILGDIDDKRPFLLIWDNKPTKKYHREYDYLLEGLDLVFERDALQFYKLPLNKFAENITARKENLSQKLQVDTLITMAPFLSTDSLNYYFYNNFDDNSTEVSYKNEGAYIGKMGQENIIFDKKMPKGKYVLSFWAFINADLYSRTGFTVVEHNTQGKEINKKFIKLHNLVKVIDNNGWALIEQSFTMKGVDNMMRITLQHGKKRLAEKPLYIDELLIRPDSTQLLMETPQWLFENNRWFEK